MVTLPLEHVHVQQLCVTAGGLWLVACRGNLAQALTVAREEASYTWLLSTDAVGGMVASTVTRASCVARNSCSLHHPADAASTGVRYDLNRIGLAEVHQLSRRYDTRGPERVPPRGKNPMRKKKTQQSVRQT